MAPEIQSAVITRENQYEHVLQMDKNENRDSFLSAVQECDSDDSSYSSAVEFEVSTSNDSCVGLNTITTKLEITHNKIWLTLFSITMYLVDVGSDWSVGIRFAAEGDWLYFMLTFLFIMVPSSFITYAGQQNP